MLQVVSNCIVSCDTMPYYVSHIIQYHAKRYDTILYSIVQSLKRSTWVNLRSPLRSVRAHFAFTVYSAFTYRLVRFHSELKNERIGLCLSQQNDRRTRT